MNADKKNWFCTTCSDGFTRRYGADRHIRNIHSGQAKRVRRIDYIIGRLSGEFSAADPLAYRRRMRQSSNRSSNSYEHEGLPSPTMTSRISSNISMRETTIKENIADLGPFSSERCAAGGPTMHRERRKSDMDKFRMYTPRLEEVKKILMTFSAPGKDPPPYVQQVLLNLHSRILERGGDDSFLEQPIRALRKAVDEISVFDVSGLLLNPEGGQAEAGSEPPMQVQSRSSTPSIKSLPQDAINYLVQIRAQLIPIYHPEVVQYKLDELTKSYMQTGNLDIFKRALVDCMNRRSG